MSKLDAALQQALTAWHIDLGLMRPGDHSGLTAERAADPRVAVTVVHTGTLAELRAAGLDAGYDQDGVVSGVIALSDVERLAAVPTVVTIAKEPEFRIMLDGTVAEMRVPWKAPPTSPWPGKGGGAIVAIVDTGIDIFHDSFRKADGKTRILELWDQAATTGGAAPPATFPQVGRVYDDDAINAGITAGPPFASVDNNGHGTHVAGIAAGNGRQDDRCSFPGRYVGVAPEADLVICRAIALPPGSTSAISEGMRWCAEAPTRLSVNKPVVINCSFGSDSGPHDGGSSTDGFVDRLVRPAAGPPAGLAIVAAAGNAGALEIHEENTVPANGSQTVSFYIAEGSVRPNHLDIWFTGAATLDIEVIAPPNPAVAGPNTTGRITPTTPGSPFSIGQMTVAIVFGGPFAANGARKNIDVTISTPANVSVRPGTWQIKLSETAGTAAVWNAWFDSKHGDAFPTFKLPGDPEHTQRRRQNTIGQPGTSRNAITVASYDDDGGKLADSSSRGPDVTPAGLPVGEFKPTVAAPGVGVRASRSRDDPDDPSSCCDQKVVDKDGTSMAAPHVTGLVALMLEKNHDLTFEQVRAHIQRAARIDGIPAGEVPPIFDVPMNIRANNLWGSGKTNAAQALADIPAAVADIGGGGGGSGGITFDEGEWGYTPHNHVSRLGELHKRFGPRPGLMLFASLVSEHVDEVLHLVNHNPRVGAVWRRNGGPLLVRHLLHGPPPQERLLPEAIEGCDVATLLERLLPILKRFGGRRLQADIARFRGFAAAWPGGDLQRLDDEALRLAAAVA